MAMSFWYSFQFDTVTLFYFNHNIVEHLIIRHTSIYSFSYSKETWLTAREFCQRMNATLPVYYHREDLSPWIQNNSTTTVFFVGLKQVSRYVQTAEYRPDILCDDLLIFPETRRISALNTPTSGGIFLLYHEKSVFLFKYNVSYDAVKHSKSSLCHYFK